MRTGAEYLRSLNDGRQVFVDGEKVKDVTAHPAFREAARSIARLYDIAAAPENRERMTFTSPKTHRPVWRAWQIPHDHADLRARRLFSETWAESTFGLMGRTPDHVAGFFAGYAATPDIFAVGGNRKFADNVVAYYEHMRDNHVYACYAIVPPQIDRSKPAHKQSDPALNATSAFDYPLSSRFDETDNYVVFDNVFVPWDNVFIYRNLEASRDQWWKTPSHLYGNHQAQTRYVTKLRFMLGLAQRLNEATGNIVNPAVQIMMGELASIASIYEGMLLAHEVNAPVDANGVLWPSKVTLYSAMALQSELNGRMLEMIRELAGGAFFTVPSSVADFDNAQTAPDIARYMQGAGTDARTRVALLRLIWDFIGSEFGSRHQQYEKFYGGASFLVKQNVFRNYDFKRATALVDQALSLPGVQ